MSEKDISYDDAFVKPEIESGKTNEILLASDIGYLKFRYYKVEKIILAETGLEGESIVKYQSEWVDRVINLPEDLDDSESEKDKRILGLEKNKRTSLPRAIEVSVGILEGNLEGENAPSIIHLPPMVITLNSGMVFERNIKNDVKAS